MNERPTSAVCEMCSSEYLVEDSGAYDDLRFCSMDCEDAFDGSDEE